MGAPNPHSFLALARWRQQGKCFCWRSNLTFLISFFTELSFLTRNKVILMSLFKLMARDSLIFISPSRGCHYQRKRQKVKAFLAPILGVALYGCLADLGISLDSKSAVKELKAVTPEKSKSCVTAFAKKLVTTFQLSRTRRRHIQCSK